MVVCCNGMVIKVQIITPFIGNDSILTYKLMIIVRIREPDMTVSNNLQQSLHQLQ